MLARVNGATRQALPTLQRPEGLGSTGLSVVLADLAGRISRFAPSRHDPERYHLEKDEIACEPRRLARLAS